MKLITLLPVVPMAMASIDEMVDQYDHIFQYAQAINPDKNYTIDALVSQNGGDNPGLRNLGMTDGNMDGAAPLSAESALFYVRNYGCWCYFDDEDGDGRLDAPRGPPRDYLDDMCRSLHQGYECASMDLPDTCTPWNVTYNAYPHPPNPNLDYHSTLEQCAITNSDPCALYACAVETNFISKFWNEFSFIFGEIDYANNHPNYGFDPHSGCRATSTGSSGSGSSGSSGSTSSGSSGSAGANEPVESCCGEYPYRFPYVSRPLNPRQCCGQHTYNPNVLSCCAGDSLGAAGSC